MRELYARQKLISTHAPAGGATFITSTAGTIREISTHAPAGGATRRRSTGWRTTAQNFYSRPCGRGDKGAAGDNLWLYHFYSRPCGRGDFPGRSHAGRRCLYFYSRPCGRGDRAGSPRYGLCADFYSRPCGRGDKAALYTKPGSGKFLLTPLREGRPASIIAMAGESEIFLLTPLREGRLFAHHIQSDIVLISTHAPAGGATSITLCRSSRRPSMISTHAPAGGATAIFHKSVMRFCGKLPKDDTVLCLASFGFPRRDPKAVYLAWISCANLPQKCVREGLALKDQGTSCFHEGLASHAFDPVLV